MERLRILITVKTYPTLSQKYGETVCTAGVREDGTWVRLYPVPFRRLGEAEKYRKYDWVECDAVKRNSDPRPESYNPVDPSQLVPAGHIGTDDKWRARRELLLEKATVHTNLDALIAGARDNALSLAVFKPARIRSFQWKPVDREWDEAKVAAMRANALQGDLFDDASWRETFRLIPKLPYAFSYTFEDDSGRSSTLSVLDWEIGALYFNCLASCNGVESDALEKVRQKYDQAFRKTDLHFFLGTTQQFHSYAPNPWVIVGLFPIPVDVQLALF